ncbi:transporter substrate-binding domain-containing protein [Sulfitobacter sp. M22]|uniref:transporter substrate-binding domain-containing protein n=1 Tax=Sulfitobacter sp. M22 TaxID=2675332 RepID=UPI001F1D1429|nr:transporter substrate-binding domain-containing protein [Sulfitobacter sp. M22]MCF7728077.1 transporter substrate-binding protein [Sulfitobacter sp. M22]
MHPLNCTSKGIPVGLLFSDSSPTAAVEATQAAATELAISEVNAAGGINGTPLVPVTVPVGPRPADYLRAAETLCDQFGVRTLFGTHMSNSRKAVLPMIEGRQALLFYPTLYEGFEFSKNCIYTGAAPNQNCLPLARYLLRHHGPRGYFIGNNYIYAHESNRIMRDLYEQVGGQILGEDYLPINVSEDALDAVMAQVVQAQPDFIYSTVVGSDTVRLYEAFARTSLRARGVPMASLATNESDLARMGADVAEGCIAAAPYFSSIDTPASRGFVSGMQERYGLNMPVTSGAEAAYFQVHLFSAAARSCGDLTVERVREALWGETFEAPEGPVHLDADTHHSYLWPRVARAGDDGRFHVIEAASEAVRPEPYMVDHSIGEPSAKDV